MKAERILVLDPQIAGISGDMLLAALLDLGADPNPVVDAIRSVGKHLKGCRSVDLQIKEVKRGEFRAKQAAIIVKERYKERKGSELVEALKATCEENEFEMFHQNLALNSLRTLVEAEANLHGEEAENVSLREAGSADTLADIIGVASAVSGISIRTTSLHQILAS